MKPKVYFPVFDWLPWLVLALIAATWYGETRMERFEIIGSGTNQLEEGDFSNGLPESGQWELGAPLEGLWQPAGGVDDGAALQLMAQDGGFVRYRLSEADRHEGYSLGLCLRLTGAPPDAPAETAHVQLAHTQKMRLSLPPRELVSVAPDGGWSCGMDAVAIPFGIDELLLEVQAPGAGALWIDRVALYPAFSSSDYDLVHSFLVAGWLAFGALALVLTWYLLGAIGGLFVVPPALSLVVYALFGTGSLTLPPLFEHGIRILETWVAEAADYLLDLTLLLLDQPLNGDWSGNIDGVAVIGLAFLGLVTAMVVGVRFRWAMKRPWTRAIACGALFGLALQALRLLVHAPELATLQWILDPLAMVAGMLLGAVMIEPMVRIYCRFARLPDFEPDPDPNFW